MFLEIGIDQIYLMGQVEDFSNRNARRRFHRNLKRRRRELRKLNEEIENIELDDAVECNTCSSSLIIKWGRYRRKVRYFLSKAKRILVQRFRCLLCGRTFSILPSFLLKFRRFARKAFIDMMDAKLSFGSGNRNTGNWNRAFRVSHTTMLREIYTLGRKCRRALREMASYFSGVMCIDDIWIRRRRREWIYALCAVDARTERVLWVDAYLSESKGDEVVDRLVEELSEIIPPQNLEFFITDDDKTLISARKKHYPDAKHQYCIFHIKRRIYHRLVPPAKYLKLSQESIQLIDCIMSIFDASTKEEAILLLSSLYKKRMDHSTKVRGVLESLWKKREELFLYMEHDIPKTNNAAEHFFSSVFPIKRVCKSFRSIKGVVNILSAKGLHWNFNDRYESKDGKTPNERSGIVTKMNMYDYV
ncbi:MAG: DUF6431 domain-containing protein, partial [Thermoplasmata archaeon]